MTDKLGKLEKLLELIYEGSVRPDDLNKLTETVGQVLAVLYKEIGDTKENQMMLEGKIETKGNRSEIEMLGQKIEEVKNSIPLGQDLSPLEERINEIANKTSEEKPALTAIEMRDALETLDGKERLDKKSIKGVDEMEKEITELKARPIGRGGGNARGIHLYTNGTKRGMANTVNIVPGTGVTLAYSYASGRNDITISAGTSLSVLTVTGTINDTNTSFTVASQPTLVIFNGASYRTTGDSVTWTYLAGTLTISQPVGSGGSIYALG